MFWRLAAYAKVAILYSIFAFLIVIVLLGVPLLVAFVVVQIADGPFRSISFHQMCAATAIVFVILWSCVALIIGCLYLCDVIEGQ